jgi:hypothetical protein
MGFFLFAVLAVACIGVAYNPGQASRALMAIPGEEGQLQGLSIDTLKKMEELNKPT